MRKTKKNEAQNNEARKYWLLIDVRARTLKRPSVNRIVTSRRTAGLTAAAREARFHGLADRFDDYSFRYCY